MILHIPHSSVVVPKDDNVNINQNDINNLTDHFTDELFCHRDSERVVFEYSRLFCDVERFRDDKIEEMYNIGQGVVYTKGSTNNTIRENISEEYIENIKSKFYDEHHRIFKESINKHLSFFGRSVIVDCHSFQDIDNKYSDFCIGFNDYNKPPFIDEVIELLQNSGYSVSVNSPYSGSIIPDIFIGNKDLFTFMIEVNRNLYLNFYNKNKNFINITKIITRSLDIVSKFEGE